jgi:hypothetical protein
MSLKLIGITIRDQEIDMAGNGNAKVPQLNRDVTGLAQTIQQLALLVGMRFVVDDQKVKAFNASADPAEPVHSIKASRNPAAN